MKFEKKFKYLKYPDESGLLPFPFEVEGVYVKFANRDCFIWKPSRGNYSLTDCETGFAVFHWSNIRNILMEAEKFWNEQGGNESIKRRCEQIKINIGQLVKFPIN